MSDLTTSHPLPHDRPALAGAASATGRPGPAPAIAGAVAVLAALGLSELAAGLLGGPSLLASIGEWLIDHQPPGAKDLVVSLFGSNDKLVFELLIVAIAIAIGAGLGIVAARRSSGVAAGVIIAFSVVGFAAAMGRAGAGDPTQPLIVALVAAVSGTQVLSWLLGGAAPRGATRREMGRAAAGSAAIAPDWSRRGFLLRAGSVAAASSVLGLVGRRLLDGPAGSSGQAIALPGVAKPATIPGGADLGQPGVTPLVMPNDAFYRIDTALIAPSVDASTWRLRVHGMVDREVSLSYADLGELPLIEQYVTIACVSNEVGGNLVGNAKWTGVKLRDVLAMAGAQPAATQLVGRSVDGWTAGMPTAWVMDPTREPMIALRMNDAPLPRTHGFPARLIVPGLYGYVSATKWLSDLELTTLEGFDGYWVPLGWSKLGPILTQSRIDTPRDGSSVPAGRVPVAGIAWAPDRGVRAVEVSVDDGSWQPAQVSVPISNTTWVQWLYAWDAASAGPGSHRISVRATDGTGSVQTSDVTPPAPDGARGHHTIAVRVR